jgi:hypothetical protein
MSAAAVAVSLLLLAGGVIWGCIVDYLRTRDNRRAHEQDEQDEHRRLMRDLRRHDDQNVRYRR